MLVCTIAVVNSQTLPNIQTSSVYLTDLKIDGLASELKDKFQAYNKATDVFYTISNDQNNLYFTLRVKYPDVISRLLLGGITLSLNHSKIKKDTTALSITFPFAEAGDRGKISNAFSRARNKKNEIGEVSMSVEELNAVLKSVTKTIKVTGLSGVVTPAISIYNDAGIRAAVLFTQELFYTYELSVPLTLLNLPNKGLDPFSYHLKMNAPFEGSSLKQGGPPPPPMEVSTAAATDFWGLYKLAKL